MRTKAVFLSLSILMTYLALTGAAAGADPSLVGWWRFDEGSGDVAVDSSSYGNNGSLQNGPKWAVGKISKCLELDGVDDCVAVPHNPILCVDKEVTAMAWIKAARYIAPNGESWQGIIGKQEGQRSYNLYTEATGVLHFSTAGYGGLSTAHVPLNEWVHACAMIRGGVQAYYVNGEAGGTAGSGITLPGTADTATLYIGRTNEGAMRSFLGMIDDVRIYNRALSQEEVQTAMIGTLGTSAGAPVPADGESDVPRDSVLAWSPGEFAKTHDVYFGTVFDDVNMASRTSPLAVLASQGQDVNSYDPTGLLTYGQTYYWRVDEVNAPPDSTVFKGSVWSFTVESYGYPVKPVRATASSSMASTMGPDKTIDGSGLDASDQHSVSASQMWLSKKGQSPVWIQYEFDKPYKLYEMWVWNSNQAVETSVGFGAREVKVETSLDGAAWTAVAEVPEFSQATGEPNYVHNTTVSLGAVEAKYVKLTISTNWADGTKQAGLSEARFFYVPVRAFGPSPANAGTDVPLDGVLNWRPGREAASHTVYVSSDSNAVVQATAPAKTVTDHSLPLSPLALQYGKTYYWRVDEVNDAATPKTWEGDLWSFTAARYGVVDDFESYNDVCNRLFFAWVDGFGHSASPDCGVAYNPGNANGSTVGNMNPPFAERTIVNSGGQSMPLAFDNSRSPFYSEAVREWASAQSWTGGGADTLVVYLRGVPAAFVETSPGNIIMNGTGTDIWDASDQFRFVYKALKGNGSITAKVNNVANTHAWAKAGVMIRESMEAGSTHAMTVISASSGASFQRRTAANDASGSTDVAGLAAPYWVKVTRTGSTFTAQTSADGVTWADVTASPAVTIPMANDTFIGLAVTSHAAEVVCGATFSNVSTTGNVTGQWQVAEVGAPQAAGNTPEAFYVALQDGAAKTAVVTHPETSVIATGAWQQWNIPLSQFSSAGINLGAVKRMTIGVGDRSSPRAGGSGKLYIDDIRLTRLAVP